MNSLLYIVWDVDPEMFTIPGIDWPVRWYGLMFAIAFLSSQYVMARVYKDELRPQKHLDLLTLYIIGGTVLGARLGHCLFYDPAHYLAHPFDIIKIWEGGLASHGGAIGIIIGMWLYCRKTKENWLWIFDRIVLVVPLSSMFIRIGNLMNSEIVGKPADVAWGFKFMKNTEDVINLRDESIPIPVRHPAQLYEAIFYLFLTVLMIWLWKKKKDKFPQGYMFGLFCVLMFSWRFIVEFFKTTQESWEESLPIDMGQILSIPFILIGIGFMVWSKRRGVYHQLPVESRE
ncbi:MAG: prolipoprotein diacylglyceryl transferase [Bacteroidia bacterium]